MSLTAITRARASALLFGGAALYTTTSPGRAQTTATLRVASIPIDAAAQVFYAKEMGFFAKGGLDVQIQVLPSVIPDAVAGNAVDTGYTSVDTLVLAHQRKIEVASGFWTRNRGPISGTLRVMLLERRALQPSIRHRA